MRNSSQNAGCIRRSPASHCCQVRQVVCTSTPAAVCDKPAASRAARTSAGAGFDSGPFGPRFGWLGIPEEANEFAIGFREAIACTLHSTDSGSDGCFRGFDQPGQLVGGPDREAVGGSVGFAIDYSYRDSVGRSGVFISNDYGLGVFDADCDGGHDLLQPLLPRGAVGKQCASHELNYTRNARKCKNFFELFFDGRGETAKPSNGLKK